jgi:Tol biopolymer transport system component
VGSHIAVESSGSIYVISPKDWQPELVISNGHYPSWSPDGTKIAYVKDNDIYISKIFKKLK